MDVLNVNCSIEVGCLNQNNTKNKPGNNDKTIEVVVSEQNVIVSFLIF